MQNQLSINEFNKIAILQTAFIGDVILTLPLVDSIKKAHPNVEIIFITTPQSAEIASISKNINKVISYDKRGLNEGLRGIKFIGKLLQENNVDCLINPHRSLRSSLVTYYSKANFTVTFKKTALSFIYDKRINYKIHLHEIERNFDLLSAFSENFDFIDLNKVELELNNDDIDFIDSTLIGLNILNKKKIIIAPGSVWKTKRWLPEYFNEIILSLQDEFEILLIGSKNDIELCNSIRSGTKAINFAGKTNFSQSLHLLSLCELLITNDSSPTHLAGLVNCPTLTIYGPTSPQYGFYPRAEKSLSIALDNLKCHPCHIHGKNECPIKTHDCMKKQTPQSVLEKINTIINN